MGESGRKKWGIVRGARIKNGRRGNVFKMFEECTDLLVLDY